MSVTLTCPTHPKYKAVREPTAKCFMCRMMYATKELIDYQSNAIKRVSAKS